MGYAARCGEATEVGFFGVTFDVRKRVYGHHQPDDLRKAAKAMERNFAATQIQAV